MPNIIQEYINEIYKFFDKAYQEGWLWYVLGLLILIFLMIMFFS